MAAATMGTATASLPRAAKLGGGGGAGGEVGGGSGCMPAGHYGGGRGSGVGEGAVSLGRLATKLRKQMMSSFRSQLCA